MKLLSILFLFLFANDSKINTIRNMFEQATVNEIAANKLIDLLNNEPKLSPTLLGYKGSTLALQAKYTINPIKKLKFFNEGKTMLERAIQSDPQNIELRYLRLAIQTNIPTFLNYYKNINSDKILLLGALKSRLVSDDDLLKKIVHFLNQCKQISPSEKNQLNTK
jgi:hypothetical protein